METSKSFQKLIRRGSNFLNCQYPIMCGAMTWISEPKLVSAVSNNGGFGCLAGGNAPVDILIKNIEETRSLTDNSFAVNLITIAPAYHEHLAMLKDQRLPYVIFAGSFPRDKEIAIAKASGAKVLCFASTESIAERMIRYGADGLILEGSEAGGHIGHVSTTILLQQVLFKFGDKLPVFVAGGMGT
ncbi:MAG: nitronate monooxygenase, partial [Victivallaceae bacterium]